MRSGEIKARGVNYGEGLGWVKYHNKNRYLSCILKLKYGEVRFSIFPIEYRAGKKRSEDSPDYFLMVNGEWTIEQAHALQSNATFALKLRELVKGKCPPVRGKDVGLSGRGTETTVLLKGENLQESILGTDIPDTGSGQV
jgi:hypothetical protein